MFQKFKSLSRLAKVGSIGGVLILIGLVNAGSHPQKTANLNATNASNVTAQQTQQPVITTKTVTETQSIPFDSKSVDDATLAQGQTKITTAGVNGTQTLTYRVTYSDGVQTSKDLVSTVTTTQPVTQVTAVGTYVAPAQPAQPTCPNGTYVNSAGNTVCSPYQSPTAPAGATAQCADGSYSFSQSRSGTCSHHGGVATWL